ncbi:hypothetical protein FOHLNKBM_6285 [Methylobacterium longum]|nr:hypothetical protein FOHLNKBM_6285 [Methylobacterium longum]
MGVLHHQCARARFNHARLLRILDHPGLELFLVRTSSQRVLQRGPIFVGDLKPIGPARPLTVVRPSSRLSSWATISISCLSTLALFATGAAWLAPHSIWTFTTSTPRAASVVSAEAPPPATFPPWVEVPHLTGPPAHAHEPDAFSVADGPRTFLDPNAADTAEQPLFLPPRANPRSPLIGRAPLDAARLTHEHPPVWNERTERQDIATSAPPAVVATLGPDVPQSLQDRAETRTTPILPLQLAQARAPTEIVVRPAQTITTAPPPGRVATLSPDPAQPVVDQTSPITPPRDTGGVVAPILNPEPARQARSLRRSRAVTTVTRARMPYRDTDQTASIIRRPGSVQARIDAGMVAHTSLHRARADRSDRLAVRSPSPAPSSPWTLPPALAPTD